MWSHNTWSLLHVAFLVWLWFSWTCNFIVFYTYLIPPACIRVGGRDSKNFKTSCLCFARPPTPFLDLGGVFGSHFDFAYLYRFYLWLWSSLALMFQQFELRVRTTESTPLTIINNKKLGVALHFCFLRLLQISIFDPRLLPDLWQRPLTWPNWLVWFPPPWPFWVSELS
jgi:hypothetical protein